MDKLTERNIILDSIVLPAFLVKAGTVSQVNGAAEKLMIAPGIPIDQLLHTGHVDYSHFTQGRMYLTLSLCGEIRGANVSKLDHEDLFLLEQEDKGEFTALSLAAKQLREPLSRALASAERLYSTEAEDDFRRLNRGLYQMLRIISNMSSAALPSSRLETVNITAVVSEVFEKAYALLSANDISLKFEAPEEQIYGLADSDQLEQAIHNLLSNAAKYLPKGGEISAALVRKEKMLHLSIRDNGSGIGQDILPTLFSRYLREPAIEDARSGLGLGMVLIKAAAQTHQGTVLIDTPEEGGTRITLTIAIRQQTEDILRSPIMRVDRYGERDHALIELSDVLPPELFDLSK